MDRKDLHVKPSNELSSGIPSKRRRLVSEDSAETADEKRLRLAQHFLKKFEEKQLLSDGEEVEIDRDSIAKKLSQQALGRKYQKALAEQLIDKEFDCDSFMTMKGHQLSVTSLALTEDDSTVYSTSKDGSVIKWAVQNGTKLYHFGNRKYMIENHRKEGHVGQVFAVAVSYEGHRDSISALCFRSGTHQLFSGSHDRTLKIWNVDEMAYIETLYMDTKVK